MSAGEDLLEMDKQLGHILSVPIEHQNSSLVCLLYRKSQSHDMHYALPLHLRTLQDVWSASSLV